MNTLQSRFLVTKQIILPNAASTNKPAIQLFPWAVRGEDTVFNGRWRSDAGWPAMRDEFANALAVADGKCLYVLSTDGAFFDCFPLNADVSENKDTPQVAWALRSSRPFDPILLVTNHRRIFVFNVRQKKVIGYIRGHGGRITSIAVHSTSPNIFATTSSDFTTRIYNLDQALKTPENPIWPPWEGPSLGSAAHGADGSDSTGYGYGHCFQILVGGRSGGHSWDVLGAAFHPHLPLIATCGADRYVKIWKIVSDKSDAVFRDDKPLFSARVTTAAVLSIAWLSEDVLLIHTAITQTPHLEEGEEDILDPGTLDVFQWLGLKRFFPAGSSTLDPVVRGGASDYQESKSYTSLSTRHLTFFDPQDKPNEPISNISQPQMLHGYFVIVDPHSKEILLLHVSDFDPTSLPANSTGDALVDMTKRIRLDTPSPSPRPTARKTPSAQRLFDSDDLDSGVVHIEACALTHSGDVVILGSKGRIWFLSEG
ncbi:hypothetical protein B0H12DRAFT_1128573 [Mycena haematopus]|nr:hypothetical protein B0H12DRAFT_1128573 [Mycena haematopus]